MRKLETGFFFVVGSDAYYFSYRYDAMLSSLSRPDRAARGPDDYDLRCTKYQGGKSPACCDAEARVRQALPHPVTKRG